MKTVIVYYSLGGFTKKIAQQLAAKTGADLLRLTPVKEYPNEGAKKFIVGGRAAVAPHRRSARSLRTTGTLSAARSSRRSSHSSATERRRLTESSLSASERTRSSLR